MIVENLFHKGFKLEDLSKTSIELDYGDCYHPDDSPSVCVEWGDIN